MTSLGVPLAQAGPQDTDAGGEAPLLVDARSAMSPHAEADAAVVPEDELCVLPELLTPSRPVARCGCSPSLQTSGRCCCAAAKPTAAKSCCAARPAAGPAEPERPHREPRDQDRQDDRFACLTCPCGSGSDAWIAVAAEPRILGDAVVLAPGGRPVESLAAIAPHLPQVFLSPEIPPPRPLD